MLILENVTLSWRRPLSYRNQSIDLLDWFLYHNGLRHERVKKNVNIFSRLIVTIAPTFIRSSHWQVFYQKAVPRTLATITGKQLSSNPFNQFLTNIPVSYPLKTRENLWFSGVFRGYKMGTWPEMFRKVTDLHTTAADDSTESDVTHAQ